MAAEETIVMITYNNNNPKMTPTGFEPVLPP